MKNKTLFLVAGIITLIVFIGYLSESGSHSIFGYSINIWIVRSTWLLLSILNFATYFKLKRNEK